jgi:hypothetical protein
MHNADLEYGKSRKYEYCISVSYYCCFLSEGLGALMASTTFLTPSLKSLFWTSTSIPSAGPAAVSSPTLKVSLLLVIAPMLASFSVVFSPGSTGSDVKQGAEAETPITGKVGSADGACGRSQTHDPRGKFADGHHRAWIDDGRYQRGHAAAVRQT